MYIDIVNEADGDLQYTECKVTGAWQTQYQVKNGVVRITFPGGPQAGQVMLADELQAILAIRETRMSIIEESFESYTFPIFDFFQPSMTNYIRKWKKSKENLENLTKISQISLFQNSIGKVYFFNLKMAPGGSITMR